MPTIARTGRAGGYVLGFEVCGRINCEVHVKSSANGRDWGAPGDLGTKVVTTDGRYLGHSPYLIWADGRLVLDAQNVYSTATNQPTEENYRAALTNSSRGRGDWSWSPAPWTVGHSSPDCNANYSPALLPAADGQLRVTAPTSTGASGPCAERTGVAAIGTLPFADRFATAGGAGWNTYGGTWVTRDGTYAVTAGGDRGPKALTGSTAWTDYTISADVTVTSPTGDAGLLARVTNPSTGPDAYDGYAAFVDVGAGTLNLARADGGYEPFAGIAVPGLSAGTAYRLTFSVRGPRLVTTIAPAAGGMTTTLAFTDPYASYFHGLAGLRDHAGTASFAHVRIAN